MNIEKYQGLPEKLRGGIIVHPNSPKTEACITSCKGLSVKEWLTIDSFW